MEKGMINKIYLAITILFGVYLIVISIVGLSDTISSFFYYGFWLVFGLLIGFKLCSFLYEKALNDKADIFKDKLKKSNRLN